ncbi:hypothetical protein [Mycobacterium kyogaense]|uniref:hypothetical protein n=1 Tax=Mycobacterium kyogaense TaxID=2212479 RepID=UPI000DAEF839|nr:hypothetical protein [Mycobacterium kyogaense]
MSGQLVGEVLAASDSLRERGLSDVGFHALIAIAEKANTFTRQASVRWDHIRAGLFGKSQRTAERAIQDLKRSKLIVVVRPGFNTNHGRAAAPIYEILPLTDPATQTAESVRGDTDTQMAVSVGGDTAKPEGRYRQIGDRSRHPDGVLDVSIDGSLDGGGGVGADGIARCARHLNELQPPNCPDCQRIREESELAAERWRAATRAAIDACDCDYFGRLDDLTDCPHHDNFRMMERAG